jgi:hypothetical protein
MNTYFSCAGQAEVNSLVKKLRSTFPGSETEAGQEAAVPALPRRKQVPADPAQ